jgi:hypothetical protein
MMAPVMGPLIAQPIAKKHDIRLFKDWNLLSESMIIG